MAAMSRPVVVVGLDRHVTAEQAERMRHQFAEIAPGVAVVFVGGCTSLLLVDADDDPS
jgi:hypothetical protein